MSKGVWYLIVAILIVILIIVLVGRRNTTNQGAFVSPTPVSGSAGGSVTTEPSPSISPAGNSFQPTSTNEVTPTTVQVTIVPTR